MATNDDPEFEPVHASSPTDHVLTELQLYGHRPFQDEPDPRPLPEAQIIAGAVVDIFDAFVSTLTDTRLEPDLEELLWSTVNLTQALACTSNCQKSPNTTSFRQLDCLFSILCQEKRLFSCTAWPMLFCLAASGRWTSSLKRSLSCKPAKYLPDR